ncbi:cysteine hydrolase family protein [Serinibacter salmoneus]|uniref:Nicotinamidase-related amidase n=1 Tax=Serinibacter salmoneus TaxID=556530 RepID=A0A2A9CXD5_9MICO|nr:cysteine hydrolase family protein [Serinibacter salmoneus]PFG19097.1 nicotinamidase-related amidase [Serinibacter salmoneus]
MKASTRTTLIVIDMQKGFDDPSWGPTTNREGCQRNVTRLIGAWTERSLPIVVVRHASVKVDSSLHRSHPGNALIDPVAAAPAALFVTKTVNSAFHGTPDLERWLRAEGAEQLVMCGIQTNMCVETTARIGGNLGFDVIVPLDATRTFDLAGPDRSVTSATTLMQTTATNLHGGKFARVTTTDIVINELEPPPVDVSSS